LHRANITKVAASLDRPLLDITFRLRRARHESEKGQRYFKNTIAIPKDVDLHFTPRPNGRKCGKCRRNLVDSIGGKDASVIVSSIALKRNVPYDIDGTVKIGVELFKATAHFHVSDVITEEQLRRAGGAPPPSGLR